MTRVVLLLASLMGAMGVIAGALAAHKAPGLGLDQASQLLLVHAVAILAAVALVDRGLLAALISRIAVAGWIIGAALFAGDIALRAFAGARLFPMAAPTGGSLLIVSWLILAVSAVIGGRRRQP